MEANESQERSETQDRSGMASLPAVNDLEEPVKKKVICLLEALDHLVFEKNRIASREDEIKDELEQLQRETGRNGFRYGWLCYRAQQISGRRTLDKFMLMENGVPAKTIEQSYKTGKPYMQQTFRRLSEDK